jgi:hypothetical protein
MRSRLPLLATSLPLALAAVGCGGSGASPVVKVSTSPWPEGPIGRVAAAKPIPGIYVPLQEIVDLIPKTLPANPKQDCREGARVEITFKDGRTLTYGPCTRPASIERLRLALIRAAKRNPPDPTQAHHVTGREWKNLINDWYDGRIDHWYRCAVVREAIKHLPTSPPTFSTVREDFDSYARAVCPPGAATLVRP